MVDSTLITLVKKRKKAAFKTLYERCINYVYAIVRRYVSNESDHKDVIQEVFARVFLKIDTYKPEKGDFKIWLRQVTINQCMQHYRQRKSPRLFVSMDAVSEMESSVDEQLTALTKAEIERYLDKMPIGYRQVFMLVVIDEYPHTEVAKMLGISTATSRSQLSRAKNWLRKNVLTNSPKTFVSGL